MTFVDLLFKTAAKELKVLEIGESPLGELLTLNRILHNNSMVDLCRSQVILRPRDPPKKQYLSKVFYASHFFEYFSHIRWPFSSRKQIIHFQFLELLSALWTCNQAAGVQSWLMLPEELSLHLWSHTSPQTNSPCFPGLL